MPAEPFAVEIISALASLALLELLEVVDEDGAGWAATAAVLDFELLALPHPATA
ncbi:MAG: hypothetical protein JO363_17520, partial [Solirubrobacterales bacterium]|nr:hypothetical protein [Solirubrobacterales bacterium]